jgi:hypothetical protein
MADETVSQTDRHFDADDARQMSRNTEAAIAIMRAVSLAAAAQQDGSVVYDDNPVSRWGPAVDAACSRVHQVRDALMQAVGAPSADWWTPLAILEATGAALWHCGGTSQRISSVTLAIAESSGDVRGIAIRGGGGVQPIALDELQTLADAAIDSLGELFEECSQISDRFGSAA